MPVASWLVNSYKHSKYETRPLEEALMKAFSENEYLFGGPRPHTLGTDIKVAVTATSSAGDPVLFANYNRVCTEKRKFNELCTIIEWMSKSSKCHTSFCGLNEQL